MAKILPHNLTILHHAGLKTNFVSEANQGEWECKLRLQRILQGVHIYYGVRIMHSGCKDRLSVRGESFFNSRPDTSMEALVEVGSQ